MRADSESDYWSEDEQDAVDNEEVHEFEITLSDGTSQIVKYPSSHDASSVHEMHRTEHGKTIHSVANKTYSDANHAVLDRVNAKHYLLLQNALANGKLQSWGRLDGVLSKAYKRHDKSAWTYNDQYDELHYLDIDEKVIQKSVTKFIKEIPSRFWTGASITWRESQGYSDKEWYTHIFVAAEQLFNIFPFPQMREAIVENYGPYLLLDTDKFQSPRNKKRGPAPILSDHDFFVEVAAYIIRNKGIPKPKKKLEYHLLDWCEKKGVKMTHSNIKQKLQPLYKKLKE